MPDGTKHAVVLSATERRKLEWRTTTIPTQQTYTPCRTPSLHRSSYTVLTPTSTITRPSPTPQSYSVSSPSTSEDTLPSLWTNAGTKLLIDIVHTNM
ncbi:hypothetical protein LSAT2_000050 [Lamellibrachia satsuma]|nr:hypothetical protein LSAT2_000050 [Lamellibrachia satsuma]